MKTKTKKAPPKYTPKESSRLLAMEDGGEVGEEAKKAAHGPGQIGEFVVEGLKTLGEAGDKVKNIPTSVQREAKGVVKKGRKLLGLESGGVLGLAGKRDSMGLQSGVGYSGGTVGGLAPAATKQGATGVLSSTGPGGGSEGAAAPLTTPPPGVITNNPEGSGGLIAGGLRQAAAKKPYQEGFLTGYKQGGFITMKGPRRGSKGVGGKRMPKKGVMA